MSFISKLTSIFSTSQAPLPNQQENIVAKALKNGLFTPYEEKLRKFDDSWSNETWFSRIQKMAEGKLDPKEQSSRLICNLFSTLVDPKVKENDKKSLLISSLKPLTKEEESSYFYNLRNVPGCMSILFLKHSEEAVWENVIKQTLEYRSINVYEQPFYQMMEEIATNTWEKSDKTAFLDKLFEMLPKETGNDVLYYFLLKAPEATKAKLLTSCSPAVADRIQALVSEVTSFGNLAIEGSKSEEDVRVRIHFRDNQRLFFLEWFFKNALECKNADLIVLGFDEKDWNWLWEKISPGARQALEMSNRSSSHYTSTFYHSPRPSMLVKLSMEWMISMANRLNSRTLKQIDNWGYDAGISLFFGYASGQIENEKGWKEIPQQMYKNLSDAFALPDLLTYSESLKGNLIKEVMKCLFTFQPEKIISWMSLAITSKKYDRDNSSEKISKIFQIINEIGVLPKAIEMVFGVSRSEPFDRLAVYSSLNTDFKKQVLKFLLSDQERSMTILVGWIACCLPGSPYNKPSVVGGFTKDLFKLLNELDPNAAKALSAQFLQKIVITPEIREFIDELLPIDVDLTDLTVRQERAIVKLKKFLVRTGVSREARESYVRSLRADIGLGESSVWLPKLFDQLPKETWPLLFLDFQHEICRSSYMNYFEEKSKGGIFNAVKDDSKPMRMSWLPDVEKWVELASDTLLQMRDNPLLKYDSSDSQTGWAMQHLYQASCESKTIYQVIARFIEKTSPKDFIAIMTNFSHSCFYYNSDGFKGMINKCLNEAKIDKNKFVVQSILEYLKEGQSRGGGVNLGRDLWNEPFLNSAERAIVSKMIISETGIQFFGLVLNFDFPTTLVIQTIKKEDPDFCERLFVESIQVLSQVTNKDDFKQKVFLEICESYSNAKYDVLKLLQMDQVQQYLAKVKSWFTETSSESVRSTTGMLLLRMFNLEAFDNCIFSKMKEIADKKYLSFWDLNALFEDLEEVGIKTHILARLKEEKQLISTLKVKFTDNIIECMKSYKADSYPLVQELVPDWQIKLAVYVQETMKKDKEKSLSYGQTPSYYELVSLYDSLNKMKLLDAFRKSLTFDDADVYKVFCKSKDKEKDEEKAEKKSPNSMSD